MKQETDLLAGILGNYVRWVILEARKRRIKRLYFLSRDGYLLWRMARIFCTRFGIALECQYLCCSRHSLNLPAFCLDERAGMEYLCRGGTDVTLSRVLKRAGLDQKESSEILEILGAVSRKDKTLSGFELLKLKNELSACPVFLEKVRKCSKQTLQNIQGYFEQEGLLEDISCAIVDSGWSGTTQETLNRILQSFGRKERIEGYYFGLYELPVGVDKDSYHSYYFSPKNHLLRKMTFCNCFFETVYTAPHGTTLGYVKTKGIYQPIFSSESFPTKKEYVQIARACLCYASESESPFLMDEKKEKKQAFAILWKRMGFPSKAYAWYYGNFPFSDDIDRKETQVLARVMNEKQLNLYHPFSMLLQKLQRKVFWKPESAWYQGSAVLYGKHPAWHLFQYTLLQFFRYLWKMCREIRKEGRCPYAGFAKGQTVQFCDPTADVKRD